MTVSQRGTPTLAASGTGSLNFSVTGTWGTGQTRVAGDLLIAVVNGYGNSGMTMGTTPAGWAEIESNWNSGAGSVQSFTYYKVATGSDAAPVFTATMAGTAADCNLACILYDLSDSGGGTPQITVSGDNAGTSGTFTVTTGGNVPSAGCFAISGAICSQGTTGASTTWTTPGSWSLGGDQTASATSQMASYYYSGPPSGSALSCLFTHSRTSTLQAGTLIVAQPPAPGALSVRAVQGGAPYEGMFLTPVVVDGAPGSPAGTTGTGSAVANVSVTPAATGSVIYGAALNGAATAFTAEASTTFTGDGVDSYNGVTYGTFRTTGTTTSGTQVTVGGTNTITVGGVAAVEIKANGTLSEDASSPGQTNTVGSTSLACWWFTPPPGSLIVVRVASNGGTGTATMTVSDTSGLTWTQQVSEAPANQGYAGVWTAQVPANPAPPAALPGPAWRQFFQPWRKAAQQRVQPPAVIAVTGSVALAPAAVSGTAAVTTVTSPPATPGPSWRRAFQPWRRAAAARIQPPAVIAASGSAALAPMAVSATTAVTTVTSPPATPGPSWQRVFQPWRRAAGLRIQPAPAITCTGSAALAAMGVAGSGTAGPLLPGAPPAAMPALSWQRAFQPWRRAAQERVQPPAVIAASGSAALAPMAVSGTDVVAAVAAPPARPGLTWRRRYQPWRRAVGQQSMPAPVIAATGSAALAAMAVAGNASSAIELAPAAAQPGPTWRRAFQPWRRAAGARMQPAPVIAATGSAALAPMAVSGTAAVASAVSPPATPGLSWQRAYQPWRRAAQQRIQPPAAVTVTGSVALAAMQAAGTPVAASTPGAALPGPAWRRIFQPWRKAAAQRSQPPVVIPVIPVTGTGITQWLNAIRETEHGIDITLHMSQVLGITLQFRNTGTEQLLILAANPVYVTVGIESLVLTRPVTQYPAVPLTAGHLYAFGPFHTGLQVPGTSTVQVMLSTAYGVQAVVVQGAWSH